MIGELSVAVWGYRLIHVDIKITAAEMFDIKCFKCDVLV